MKLLWLTLAAAAPALAQSPPHPIPEAERWATITHAGNEPYVFTTFNGDTYSLGRVDHEYQISRTEVTGAEWFEFVQAYAPYAGQEAISTSFLGSLVQWSPTGGYRVRPGGENKPVDDVGWHYAARYVNWLHNDRRAEQAAFENGAYDTSTFGVAPDGSLTDQLAHSPGSRYWIPTQDELIKAYHFDPNRYGPDQPGYWLYSTSSDTAPTLGAPGIGQTNAASNTLRDVASYRDVQSPWGLWDTSGGATEWTESADDRRISPPYTEAPWGRWFDGSSWRVLSAFGDILNPLRADRIDGIGYTGWDGSRIGLRVARQIPSPSSAIVLFGAVHLFTSRRRTAHDTPRPAFGLRTRPRPRLLAR